jgi:hypothetical protein
LLAHGRAGPGRRTLPFQGKTKRQKNEQNTQNNHQNIHFFSPTRLVSPFGDQQPQGFF